LWFGAPSCLPRPAWNTPEARMPHASSDKSPWPNALGLVLLFRPRSSSGMRGARSCARLCFFGLAGRIERVATIGELVRPTLKAPGFSSTTPFLAVRAAGVGFEPTNEHSPVAGFQDLVLVIKTGVATGYWRGRRHVGIRQQAVHHRCITTTRVSTVGREADNPQTMRDCCSWARPRGKESRF
jgi:hypothetical protein